MTAHKDPLPDFSDVDGGSSSTARSPQPEAGSEVMHTVQSGESLSKIAKEHYGDASKWKRIHEANKDQISNPDLIHPGQVFRIPEA